MAATRPYSMKGVCGARGAPALATGSAPRPGRTVQRPSICRVLAFTTGSSNGQGPQENSSNGAGKASSAVVLEAPPSVVAGTSLTPQQQRIFEELAASPSAGVATTTPTPMQAEAVPQAASQVQSTPAPAPLFRADEAWQLFEERLEADLKTVGVTLVAIMGVIIFWRGVWSLLDLWIGDNPLGDLCCVLVGLGIILYIRLAGLRVGSFWPSG